jgi:transposase InsO family protein
MYDTEHVIRARRKWVELYAKTKNASLVCRRCGISAPTLRKWWRRYLVDGEIGLRSRSRRPLHSPGAKLTDDYIGWIVQMRVKRNLGPRRIQAELIRLHALKLSTATIWKVLNRHGLGRLRSGRTPRQPKSYSREVPGERVQMDTVKIAPGLFQFTAVDDCTRMRVLALYPRRTAYNAVRFLQEHVLEEFPFPIQRIQTDRGGEFFGTPFQRALMDHAIKFRPIRPYSPHLNGKVERSQRTDRVEFYATVERSDPQIGTKLKEWQHFYNWTRPHGAHGGRPPVERYFERQESTPLRGEVVGLYNSALEDYRQRNYALDQRIQSLRCRTQYSGERSRMGGLE